MIWYRHPEFQFQYLTDSIVVQYNNSMVARIEYTDQAQIRDIFVQPEYRRQGIARYLITLMERRTGHIATPMLPVSKLGRFLFPQ